jgi:hypothetical protein
MAKSRRQSTSTRKPEGRPVGSKSDERSLARLYKISIEEQFAHLEREPALSRTVKLGTLYETFKSLVEVIKRLSDLTPPGAPELWAERDPSSKETIHSFLRRVYGPYREHGMTMAGIAKLDFAGYQAWYGWRKLPSNRGTETPLPTRAQANDAAIAAIGPEVPTLAEIAKGLPPALRDQLRLSGTAANRRHRAKKAGRKEK